MDAGRLLHICGPLTTKDWSPNVVLVGGTSSLVADDDDLRPD